MRAQPWRRGPWGWEDGSVPGGGEATSMPRDNYENRVVWSYGGEGGSPA